LTEEEKQDRLELASLAEKCMAPLPDPPEFVDADTSFPVQQVTTRAALAQIERLEVLADWRI